MTSTSFVPICNSCLTEIEGGTQGFLLSCGHFICRVPRRGLTRLACCRRSGCCPGAQPSVCPHCGSRGRAAELDHPPAEVRDYLQHPSSHFRTVSDVVMFQLDHFRSAAKQAGKALHEVRLLYSREVKRREEAEKDTQAWRKRAQTAEENAQGMGRDGFGRGGSLSAGLGPKKTLVARSTTSGVGDGAISPIGTLRQRFFGSRDEQRTPTAGSTGGVPPTGGSSRSDHSGGGRENTPQDRPVAGDGAAPLGGLPRSSVSADRGQQPQARPVGARGQRPQSAAGKAPGTSRAAAVASGASDTGARPTMSFSGPSPARPVARGEARKPDTPRVGLRQHSNAPASSQQLRVAPEEQRPRQWTAETPQRTTGETPQLLGTPGRPVRPAWQDGHSPRGVAARGGGGGRGQLGWRPHNSQNGQVPSSLSHQLEQQQHQQQQQQQSRRPERSSMEGVRRPTPSRGSTNALDQLAATSPRKARGDTSGSGGTSTPGGSGHPNRSSPPSPLLACRGVLKRPSSGGLPPAKRPGSASGTERTGAGNHQGRPGTPMTPLRSSSPTARLRSPQLPFTARSTTTRAGPGQPSWNNTTNPGVGRAGNSTRGTLSTPTSGRQAAAVPLSLEAAGLFSRR